MPQLVEVTYPGTVSRTIDFVSAEVVAFSGQVRFYATELRLTTLGVFARINAEHCLTPHQRAATLQILSEYEELTYLGPVIDRRHRPGVAFAMQGQDVQGNMVRDVLVVDETTTAVLAYEQTLSFSGRRGEPITVISYLTFLGCTVIPPRI